jgi:hypothetical protein
MASNFGNRQVLVQLIDADVRWSQLYTQSHCNRKFSTQIRKATSVYQRGTVVEGTGNSGAGEMDVSQIHVEVIV